MSAETLIIGGGAIGICCAYYLNELGKNVLGFPLVLIAEAKQNNFTKGWGLIHMIDHAAEHLGHAQPAVLLRQGHAQQGARQPHAETSSAPKLGAMTGAAVKIIVIRDMSRAASLPDATSRTIARDRTIADAAPIPCT